ncbi:helix-turn-helix domain-containing protein [Sneathiella sp.]|jgi:AraC-like DNA-binding protein|uniref:helix-turn-helix transcriptional regulator n=1 Tax=Sneathiella sp. TaxID=1964365 RepID=UPI0039E5D74B
MIKRLAFENSLFSFLEQERIPTLPIKQQLETCNEDRLTRLRLLAYYAVQESRENHLGLIVGLKTTTLSYGILGHAILHCDTLLKSQQLMLDHIWVLQPTPRNPVSLELSGQRMAIRYLLPPLWPEIPNFFLDLFFSANLARARELTGHPLDTCRLELRRDKPDDYGRYEKLLGIPVSYAQPYDRLIYDRAFAERPLSASYISHSAAYREQCKLILSRMRSASGLAEHIRKIIMEDRSRSLTMENVADLLNQDTRTLRRHLKKEGTSFRDIQNEVRCHIARQYLTDTDLSVADIAVLSGYFDSPTFSRAFKGWTGKTPPEYRKNNN